MPEKWNKQKTLTEDEVFDQMLNYLYRAIGKHATWNLIKREYRYGKIKNYKEILAYLFKRHLGGEKMTNGRGMMSVYYFKDGRPVYLGWCKAMEGKYGLELSLLFREGEEVPKGEFLRIRPRKDSGVKIILEKTETKE